MREQHLKKNLLNTHYTIDLYRQYKRQLGTIRYRMLKEAQVLVVPQRVNDLLNLGRFSYLRPVIPLYKFSRWLKLDWFLKSMILPKQYRSEIKALDRLAEGETITSNHKTASL